MQEKMDEDWEQNFYIPLFSVTYKHLKKGGYFILNVPKDLYETICVDLFGKADIKIPLKMKIRPKNSYTKKGYSEYIYVWKKNHL
jgi:hypothetical protein